MTRVKICGITELEQGLAALEAGADMLGFVLAASRRQLSPERAASLIQSCREQVPPQTRPWLAVGVFAAQPFWFVERTAERCGMDVVQLSGNEPPEYCLRLRLPVYKAIHVSNLATRPAAGQLGSSHDDLRFLRKRCGAERLLLDAGGAGRWGGTGQNFEWQSIGPAAVECIVAGGLNPANVAAAISAMHPWAVDVSSGVEVDGRKDAALIRSFITEVRRSDGDEP